MKEKENKSENWNWKKDLYDTSPIWLPWAIFLVLLGIKVLIK